jgi:hypothetical protein
MSRILAALVVTLAFGGALAYGGHAMGAWEPYEPVPDKAGTRVGADGGAPSQRAKKRGKGVNPARTKAAPPTWADRANAICRRARPDLEVLARELGSARSPEEVEAGLAALVQANRRVNARLRAIPPARRQRARLRALHRALTEDERLLAGIAAAVRRRDEQALRTLAAAAEPVVRKENELFWVLGANECTVAAYLGGGSALV